MRLGAMVGGAMAWRFHYNTTMIKANLEADTQYNDTNGNNITIQNNTEAMG